MAYFFFSKKEGNKMKNQERNLPIHFTKP